MRPHRRGPAFVPAAVCWLLAVCVSACTSVSPGGSASSLMQANNVRVSIQELRTTQNILAVRVPGTLEEAADAISAQTTDVALKRRALLFKVELIPAFYEAFFNPDPLAALLDAWALSIQLEGFLQTGPGRDALAPLQSIALDAARKVRGQIEVAARSTAKSPDGFERAKSVVEKWAEAHPIEGSFSSRASILPELAKLSSSSSDISVFQAVGDITGTVNDIAARLDIYAAYLPKAGRWQAELLADEMADRTDAQHVLSTFQSVQKFTDRINQLLSVEALQAGLGIATSEVRKERLALLASVDEQRQATLAYVTSEREAAVAALDAQRRDVMADVDRERLLTLQQLDALKKQSLLEVDDVGTRLIRKGALAMAGLLILAAALTLGVLRFAQRPKPPTEPPRS